MQILRLCPATEISGLRSVTVMKHESPCEDNWVVRRFSVCTDPRMTRQWDKEERALRRSADTWAPLPALP